MEDCIERILSLCTPCERFCLRRTCKDLYKNLKDKRIHLTYCEEACGTNLQLVQYFCYSDKLLTEKCFEQAVKYIKKDILLWLKSKYLRIPEEAKLLHYAAKAADKDWYLYIERLIARRNPFDIDWLFGVVEYGNLELIKCYNFTDLCAMNQSALFLCAVRRGDLTILKFLVEQNIIFFPRNCV